MIYQLAKKILFKLDPEVAHHLSFFMLSKSPSVLGKLFCQRNIDEKYSVKLNNMQWSFPVGLAAGLDKNAESIPFFSSLYFGAIEVGTVTPLPQAGNPKPRLFRYIEEESLRNKMGFNNDGMEKVLTNISRLRERRKCLGVNLGKNKTTPNDQAALDYKVLYEKFADISDYLVINASSPNTPGLRDLLAKEGLKSILDSIEGIKKDVPLYLKLSPDMNKDDVRDAITLVDQYALSGIIATNTTIMPDRGEGGISGKLLKEKAASFRGVCLEILKEYPHLDFIGVGGIDCYEDLVEFWKLGGRAVQVYTSFIFQGPDILNKIKESIDKDLAKLNLKNVNELIEYYKN